MSLQFRFEVPDPLHLSESILYAARGAEHHRHTRCAPGDRNCHVELHIVREQGGGGRKRSILGLLSQLESPIQHRQAVAARVPMRFGTGERRRRATIDLKLVLFFKNNNKYSGRPYILISNKIFLLLSRVIFRDHSGGWSTGFCFKSSNLTAELFS
ncbi:hypothetical protein AAZX31_12G078900 [Glycine max]